MDYKQWDELKHEMAIKAICNDLADLMIPTAEAIPRAIRALEAKQNQALDVEYRMGQALIALESLGYLIIKVNEE